MRRAGGWRVASLAVVIAAGTMLVLLGAHVTPSRYHAHPRYITPPVVAGRSTPAASPSPSSAPPSAAPRKAAHAGWVNVLVLLVAAAGVGAVVVSVLMNLGRRGRWARRRRVESRAPPASELAAGELTRRLADALDTGLEDLAGGPVGDVIVACWLNMRAAAIAAGVEPRRSDSPEEFIDRVLAGARVRPGPLRDLAELYREARFSAHRMDESDRSAARAALESVRDDLLAGARA